MSAYFELTFFKRLQVVRVLHACSLIIVFLFEAFLGFELMLGGLILPERDSR